MSRSKRTTQSRTGAAATEFALIVPVILVLFAGTVELCTTIFVKEAVTIAAYEGARAGIQRKSTNQNIYNRVEAFLASRNIEYEGSIQDIVEITPDVTTAATLEPIVVSVSVPIQGNTVLPFSWLQFVTVDDITVEVVMRKEFPFPTSN